MEQRVKLREEKTYAIRNEEYQKKSLASETHKKINQLLDQIFNDEKYIGIHNDTRYHDIPLRERFLWMTLLQTIAQEDANKSVVLDIVKRFPHKLWLYEKLHQMHHNWFEAYWSSLRNEAVHGKDCREESIRDIFARYNEHTFMSMYKVGTEEIDYFLNKLLSLKPEWSWEEVIESDEKIHKLLVIIREVLENSSFEERMKSRYNHVYYNYWNRDHLQFLMEELYKHVTTEELEFLQKEYGLDKQHPISAGKEKWEKENPPKDYHVSMFN